MTACPSSHGMTTGPNQATSPANRVAVSSQAFRMSLAGDHHGLPARASRAVSSRQAERSPPSTDRGMNR